MNEIIIYAFFSTFFVMLSFLFSGSEMALISVNKYRLKKQADAGNKNAKKILNIIKNPTEMINTILIGINLSVVSGSIFIHSLLKQFIPHQTALIALFLSSAIFLIIGELIPKSIFRYAPNKLILKIAPFLILVFKLLRPFEKIFTLAVKKFIKIKNTKSYETINKNDFLKLIDLAYEEKTLSETEKKLIEKTFELKSTYITKIMIPLEKVCLIDENTTVENAKRIIKAQMHSRVPVFSTSKNNIIGITNIYDIFSETNSAKLIKQIMRPPAYISKHTTCDKALLELSKKKIPILIVAENKNNNMAIGIVTEKNLIDHFIGEITKNISTNIENKRL